MEEETRVEMELKGIEEAASRATLKKRMVALEASKANGVALRQTSGGPKGGAWDSARECGGKGGGEESQEGKERGAGDGNGSGEEEETEGAAMVMVKISIQEAKGKILEKFYSVKKVRKYGIRQCCEPSNLGMDREVLNPS